jgi:hypothetical protein
MKLWIKYGMPVTDENDNPYEASDLNDLRKDDLVALYVRLAPTIVPLFRKAYYQAQTR